MPHLGHDHVRRNAALQLVSAGVPQGVGCRLLAPEWTECRSQPIEDFSDDRVSYGSAIIADAVGEEQIPLVSGVRNDRPVVREVRPELFGDLGVHDHREVFDVPLTMTFCLQFQVVIPAARAIPKRSVARIAAR